MANVPTFAPTEYGNFDPSQWTNPYSSFQNSGIPFPASYSGWPTDSMGNPIQAPPGMQVGQPSAAAAAPASTPGTTLNSTPNAPQSGILAGMPAGAQAAAGSGSPFGAMGGQLAGWQALANPEQAAAGNTYGDPYLNMVAGQQAPQQAAPPTPAANPSGLTSQQYLQLLAHPNPVATPGANIPQSAQSYQPNNSVLQQFLANWTPAKSGPGSGFQQAFAKGLKGS